VGWSVSAVLAVPYVLVMLASLLLVGWFTTGSWQAVFLGIGWSTIAGFEIGLFGVVTAGFAAAAVSVPAYNAVRRRAMSHSRTPSIKSWAFRQLAACLVLPTVTLVALRVLAPVLSSGAGGWSEPENTGPTINTAHREAEPSFTADGRTMYFNCNSGDICVSHLVGTWEVGNWTPPERLGAPISTEYEEVEPVINATGDKLYFTSIRPGSRLWGIPFLSPFINVFRVANTLAPAKLGRSLFGGLGLPDVYVSYWINGAWSEPRNLNDVAGEPPVNTEFADHCLFFSADGNEAFWTSTRPGGFGDNDIWTSRRVGGKWTQAENLGPNVNGPGSEHTSIPTPNGQLLYVTATRDEGFGGEDIYVTTRGADSTWGALVNLGPLVNGPGDDRCPAWTPDLMIFLFDSVREGGYGGRDIWWVYFKDVRGYPLDPSASTYEPAPVPQVSNYFVSREP
jgi:hypothetical protein